MIHFQLEMLPSQFHGEPCRYPGALKDIASVKLNPFFCAGAATFVLLWVHIYLENSVLSFSGLMLP